MSDGLTAVAHALELARAPMLAGTMREQPLPNDVLLLIRIAGGCVETCRRAAAALRQPPDAVTDAAMLYVQQVLFHPDSDCYRVLGVGRAAEHAQIHDHFRALMKWLHPDTNGTAWESLLANRVVTAWDVLKTPDRRAAYDSGLDARDASPGPGPKPRSFARRPRQPQTASPPITQRPVVGRAPKAHVKTLRRRIAVAMIVVTATFGLVLHFAPAGSLVGSSWLH